ncbi:MAG: ion channel [Planctomycetota bacterium]|nr:ion channel [Planctomycetota bacterium]
MSRYRFAQLLAAILLLMLTAPIVRHFGPELRSKVAGTVITVSLTAMFLSAVFAVSKRRKTTIIALSLAGPALALHVLWLASDRLEFEFAGNSLKVLFLGYVVIVILGHLFTVDRVTFDTICASLCAYLLIAVLWAVGYSLLYEFIPGSFAFAHADPNRQGSMHFGGDDAGYAIYYSLVTMTTLGYGDIVPTSPAARMSAAVQAFVGQLYLAVLVARLVAMHIMHSHADKAGRSDDR